MRNREVVEEFIRGYNFIEGYNQNRTLYYRDNVLFSYGEHYPLAIKLENGYEFLVNADYYSVTTSQHKGLVKNIAGEERIAEVSFDLLKKILKEVYKIDCDFLIEAGRITILDKQKKWALLQHLDKKFLVDTKKNKAYIFNKDFDCYLVAEALDELKNGEAFYYEINC